MINKLHEAKEDKTGWRHSYGYGDGLGCGSGIMVGDCSLICHSFWGDEVVKKWGHGTPIGAGSESGSGRGHG